MSALIHTLRTLCLALALSAATHARAMPEQAVTLATCYGYYAAAVDHSRLDQGEHDGARMRRDLFEAMTNALVAEQATDRRLAISVTQTRVQARAQMRRLMRSAYFDADARRQRIALANIRRQLSACNAALLGRRYSGF